MCTANDITHSVFDNTTYVWDTNLNTNSLAELYCYKYPSYSNTNSLYLVTMEHQLSHEILWVQFYLSFRPSFES